MGLETTAKDIWSSYKQLPGNSGRDLYVIDPRGVGMAYPRLHCPEALDPIREILGKGVSARDESDEWLVGYQACKKRLQEHGHDLSQYNSRIVARDVESLRRALKIRKWVLLGNSYGARYALTVARDFPQSVEAMVLNGAAFPNVRYTDDIAQIYNSALEKAFSWCERSGTCDATSLRERFWNLVRRFDETPLILDPLDTELAETYSVAKFVLTGERLGDVVFFALYDADFFPRFPDLIEELERHTTQTLEGALTTWFGLYLDVGSSDAVNYSHYCAEEFPFASHEAALANAGNVHPYIRGWVTEDLRGYQEMCALWDVVAANPIEGKPVTTPIPVLFLQGALDPTTPIDYLGDQLRYFEHHEVLIFDGSSHWGAVYGGCAMRTAAYFIRHHRLDEGYIPCPETRSELPANTHKKSP